MTTLEGRVREALRADAEAVRPGTIPGVPLRPARPAPGRAGFARARILIPLAAAAAVIAIVTGLSLIAPHMLSGGRPGSGLPSSLPSRNLGPAPLPVVAANASRTVSSSAPAPGVPRFYVTSYIAPEGPLNYIVVRDTATGRVTGEIHPPGTSFFGGLAATAGDRTFITTLNPGTGCGPVQLYWFQLNELGVPGPLEPLHITLPGGVGEGTSDLAVTPDGSTIAYASGACNSGESEVGVINLATRQARAWAYSLALPGLGTSKTPSIGPPQGLSSLSTISPSAMWASDIGDLSLSADGQLLSFATFDGTSLLRTSAPAGPLYDRSRLVSKTMIWAAVAEDGQALYGCAASPYRRPGALPSVGTLTYGQFSLTGRGAHVIASWANVNGPQCYASVDPAGNYLLVQYPTVVPNADNWSRPAILDLGTGQLTYINAPAFYGPFDIAW